MVEGKIEIFLSYKEPEYRDNLMWLRPYLDREGYELLYWGANGWTRFIPCHPISSVPEDKDMEEDLTCIGPNPIGNREGELYEISSPMKIPEKEPSCGCPNQ